MFHTTLEEFKPKGFENIEGESYTTMPKFFNYYAGGHVHYRFDIEKEGYRKIVYPGPLFPNNFKELEELKQGSICIVDERSNVKRFPIKIKDVEVVNIDVNKKASWEAKEIIESELNKRNIKDKIVALRVSGELTSGKISDINFNAIGSDSDAYVILKNINKLTTKTSEKIDVKGESKEEIEETLIKEQKVELENQEKLTKQLMIILAEEKHEGETNTDFENRIVQNVKKVVQNEN